METVVTYEGRLTKRICRYRDELLEFMPKPPGDEHLDEQVRRKREREDDDIQSKRRKLAITGRWKEVDNTGFFEVRNANFIEDGRRFLASLMNANQHMVCVPKGMRQGYRMVIAPQNTGPLVVREPITVLYRAIIKVARSDLVYELTLLAIPMFDDQSALMNLPTGATIASFDAAQLDVVVASLMKAGINLMPSMHKIAQYNMKFIERGQLLGNLPWVSKYSRGQICNNTLFVVSMLVNLPVRNILPQPGEDSDMVISTPLDTLRKLQRTDLPRMTMLEVTWDKTRLAICVVKGIVHNTDILKHFDVARVAKRVGKMVKGRQTVMVHAGAIPTPSDPVYDFYKNNMTLFQPAKFYGTQFIAVFSDEYLMITTRWVKGVLMYRHEELLVAVITMEHVSSLKEVMAHFHPTALVQCLKVRSDPAKHNLALVCEIAMTTASVPGFSIYVDMPVRNYLAPPDIYKVMLPPTILDTIGGDLASVIRSALFPTNTNEPWTILSRHYLFVRRCSPDDLTASFPPQHRGYRLACMFQHSLYLLVAIEFETDVGPVDAALTMSSSYSSTPLKGLVEFATLPKVQHITQATFRNFTFVRPDVVPKPRPEFFDENLPIAFWDGLFHENVSLFNHINAFPEDCYDIGLVPRACTASSFMIVQVMGNVPEPDLSVFHKVQRTIHQAGIIVVDLEFTMVTETVRDLFPQYAIYPLVQETVQRQRMEALMLRDIVVCPINGNMLNIDTMHALLNSGQTDVDSVLETARLSYDAMEILTLVDVFQTHEAEDILQSADILASIRQVAKRCPRVGILTLQQTLVSYGMFDHANLVPYVLASLRDEYLAYQPDIRRNIAKPKQARKLEVLDARKYTRSIFPGNERQLFQRMHMVTQLERTPMSCMLAFLTLDEDEVTAHKDQLAVLFPMEHLAVWFRRAPYAGKLFEVAVQQVRWRDYYFDIPLWYVHFGRDEKHAGFVDEHQPQFHTQTTDDVFGGLMASAEYHRHCQKVMEVYDRTPVEKRKEVPLGPITVHDPRTIDFVDPLGVFCHVARTTSMIAAGQFHPAMLFTLPVVHKNLLATSVSLLADDISKCEVLHKPANLRDTFGLAQVTIVGATKPVISLVQQWMGGMLIPGTDITFEVSPSVPVALRRILRPATLAFVNRHFDTTLELYAAMQDVRLGSVYLEVATNLLCVTKRYHGAVDDVLLTMYEWLKANPVRLHRDHSMPVGPAQVVSAAITSFIAYVLDYSPQYVGRTMYVANDKPTQARRTFGRLSRFITLNLRLNVRSSDHDEALETFRELVAGDKVWTSAAEAFAPKDYKLQFDGPVKKFVEMPHASIRKQALQVTGDGATRVTSAVQKLISYTDLCDDVNYPSRLLARCILELAGI